MSLPERRDSVAKSTFSTNSNPQAFADLEVDKITREALYFLAGPSVPDIDLGDRQVSWPDESHEGRHRYSGNAKRKPNTKQPAYV
jgi:hypothetical protein